MSKINLTEQAGSCGQGTAAAPLEIPDSTKNHLNIFFRKKNAPVVHASLVVISLLLAFLSGIGAAQLIPDAAAAMRRTQGDKSSGTASPAACKNQITGDYAELSRFANVLAHIQNSHISPPTAQRLIDGAIRGLTTSLDPYSAYMSEAEVIEMAALQNSGKRAALGLALAAFSSSDVYRTPIDESTLTDRETDRRGKAFRSLIVIAPEDGSPAARAGIEPGDLITHIDGLPTGGMDAERAEALLRGEAGTKVSLGILRRGFREPRLISLTRELPAASGVDVSAAGDGSAALIRIKRFAEGTADAVKSGIAALERSASAKGQPIAGLILDLRNNPGGRLDEAVKTADLFLSGGRVVYRLSGRNGDILEEPMTHTIGSKNHLPMAILVNGGTASAAEILAGALQDEKRGILIGEKTFGKGSVQLAFSLEGGGALKLTVAVCTTPKGRRIHGEGLVPDIRIDNFQIQKGHVSQALDFPEKITDTASKSSSKKITRTHAGVETDSALKKALDIIASDKSRNPLRKAD